jgi:hypothetical protein
VLNPCDQQEELRGTLLGHLVDLKAKARGDKRLPEQREALEHAEGADRQDPGDRATAGWRASPSPEVNTPTHGDRVSQPCGQDQGVHRAPPETSPRSSMEHDPIHGEEWDASVALDTCNTDGTRARRRDESPLATECPEESEVGKACRMATGHR